MVERLIFLAGFIKTGRVEREKLFHGFPQHFWEEGEMRGPGTSDVILILLSYGYVLAIIAVSGHLEGVRGFSRGSTRKFLHAIIGNLVLVIPFFRWPQAPALIAAPFILVTFLASPYSPIPRLRVMLGSLADLTEEGHHMGLIFYSISFTLLVVLFPTRPDVVAAGILPMAYGDSSAALVGRRMGRWGTLNGKTVEGSVAMFTVTLASLVLCLAFFASFMSFTMAQRVAPSVLTALVCTVVEAVSPRGSDNIAVPLLGALTFYAASGGF
jgi:dolichol kinase